MRRLGGAGMIYLQHRKQQPSPPSPPTPAQPQRTHEDALEGSGASKICGVAAVPQLAVGVLFARAASPPSSIVIGIGIMAPWRCARAE